ncbi:putative uncharacterized protein [Clostridium sp. CAG:470]|nr:putative uncharacterized protein [Clostridium sp. CAG:470]
MEEKILNELTNINGQLQTMNQRFDKVDERFDGIDQRLDGMDQRFDGIDQRFEEVDKSLENMNQKIDDTKDEIVTTLRKELDDRLTITENKICDDVSDNIKSLCDSITRLENNKHNEIIALLKIHESREARRMEIIKQAFAG